jgi:hypothetical protein
MQEYPFSLAELPKGSLRLGKTAAEDTSDAQNGSNPGICVVE